MPLAASRTLTRSRSPIARADRFTLDRCHRRKDTRLVAGQTADRRRPRPRASLQRDAGKDSRPHFVKKGVGNLSPRGGWRNGDAASFPGGWSGLQRRAYRAVSRERLDGRRAHRLDHRRRRRRSVRQGRRDPGAGLSRRAGDRSTRRRGESEVSSFPAIDARARVAGLLVQRIEDRGAVSRSRRAGEGSTSASARRARSSRCVRGVSGGVHRHAGRENQPRRRTDRRQERHHRRRGLGKSRACASDE